MVAISTLYRYCTSEVIRHWPCQFDISVAVLSRVKPHFKLSTACAEVPYVCHQCASCNSCAAGPCLIFHTPLVGTHTKAAVGCRFHKVDVSPLWAQVWMMAQPSPLPYHIIVCQVFHLLHIMGHTRIQQLSLQHIAQRSLLHIAHTQSHYTLPSISIPMENGGVMRSVVSPKAKCRLLSYPMAQPQQMGKHRKASSPISAHIGRVAVSVVIAHRHTSILSPHCQQYQSVGAHTLSAMADVGYRLRRQFSHSLSGVHHYKIVACSVKLIKMYFHYFIIREL